MILYHYTLGIKINAIYDSGVLNLSPITSILGEKPIVWLSKNSKYELTALKGIYFKYSTRSRLMTLEESDEIGKGIYRFIFDKNTISQKIYPWEVLKRKANKSKNTITKFETRALNVGANPCEWHGALKELPIDNALLQRLNLSTKKWLDIKPNSIKLDSNVVEQIRACEAPIGLGGLDSAWKLS